MSAKEAELLDEVRAMRRELAELRGELKSAANQQQPAETYVGSDSIQAHFGVSRATVHNWVHDEGCPHEQRGKVLRFKMSAVEDWFRGRRPTLKKVR